MTGKAYCYHHDQIVRQRNMRKLPFLKNAADVQQAIMDLMQAMIERRIAFREGTALLYGLQLTQTNLKTSGFQSGLATLDAKGSFINHLLDGLTQEEVIETEVEHNEREAHRKESEELMNNRESWDPEMQKRLG
jgi:hypothetical protein